MRGRRAEIHANIADAMERDAGTVVRQPILLAYHCAEAGLMEKAATYYRQAADQSKSRGALAETKALLDHGLALAVALPDSPGTRLLKAELWTARGRLQHMVRNFGDEEALTALERAVDWARTLDNTEPLAGALRDLALNRLLRGDHEAGWRDVQELFCVSLTTGDAKERIFAYSTRGFFRFAQGRFEEASADLQIALQLYSHGSNTSRDVTSNSDWAAGLRFSS